LKWVVIFEVGYSEFLAKIEKQSPKIQDLNLNKRSFRTEILRNYHNKYLIIF